MAESQEAREVHRFITRVLITAAIIALFALAWYLRGLLLLLFGSVLVSVLLRLIAKPIHTQFRVTNGIALAIAALLVLAVIGLIFWFFGAEISRQTEELEVMLPNAWQSFQARLDAVGWGDSLRQGVENFRASALTSFGRFALSVTNGIGDTILAIAGGIYLAAQPHLYKTGLLKLIPPDHRDVTSDALDCADLGLALWLRGRMVSMLVVGMLTAIGLYIIGVPSWLSLGLLSGLLEFIPFLGPLISAVPAVLLALAHSPQAALWTIGLYLLVQQLEGNLIEPMIQQRAVRIPPLLLLFSIITWALLFGIGGIVVAAPLTVVVFMLVKRLYVREALGTPTPLPTDPSY
jgi:predicted PurR-regulated permease PerM